jgi:hypothetical protein
MRLEPGLETQRRDRIPAGLPAGFRNGAAPSDPANSIVNAAKDNDPLAFPAPLRMMIAVGKAQCI